MVEWEDDEATRGVQADWEISWEGKRTVLPAKEQPPPPPPPQAEAGAEQPPPQQQQQQQQPINRLYFLLGPGVEVPATVSLQKGAIAWKTNPLPAIFSPDLGATAREAGRKGVLHTIWAKKRLQVLQHEIARESHENSESVGLEMAAAEKEWIELNFGLAAKPAPLSIPASAAAALNGPASPRSPGGGRLMDKLKGLRLGTSSADLSSAAGVDAPAHNPLSPETSDVAVGSFGSFAALKGVAPPSSLAAKPAQPPRRIAAQRPPESFAALQQQQQQAGGMGSLNALAGGLEDTGFSSSASAAPAAPAANGADDDADDLFALPMSPRSPDMAKAPFSFGAQDTMRYLQGGKA
nr:hypothetical protein CFP56_04106 [Quercus suber]